MGLLGDDLLQRAGFPAQLLDLAAGRRPRGVARQPPFAGLQELLRPDVIQTLGDALAPAEFRDAMLAAQAVQHDADLLLRRILLARRSANVLHDPLGGRLGSSGFLACLMRNALPCVTEAAARYSNMPGSGGGRIGSGLVTVDRR